MSLTETSGSWWEPVVKPSVQFTDASTLNYDAARSRGLVVMITDGHTDSVIGRVAWSRAEATGLHKFGSFKRSLRRVLARAEAECERLNERK